MATRGDLLAVVCVLAWAGACFAVRWVGMWGAIGSVALALAIVVAPADESVRRTLHSDVRIVALGLLAALAMVGVTYAAFPPLVRMVPALGAQTGALYGLFRANWGPWVPALLPVVVLAEEIIWRGLVQSRLAARWGPTWAVPLAALVYAAVHAPIGQPLLVGVALACGLYWSCLRGITGSLVPGLIAHLLWDALVFLLKPLT